jgi:polyisoprenoid-binding protein YceI
VAREPEENRSQTDTHASARPRPRSRLGGWRRWLVGVVVVLVALVAATARVYIGTLSEPPLALPTTAASTPVGPLEGSWSVAHGSVAGFRIEQTVMFMTGDVVGRTSDISGTLIVSGGAITSARFDIDLTTVTSGGKDQPQFALSLDTKDHPMATFTLAGPVGIPIELASGATSSATVTGVLAMRGTSHEVAVTISGRRNGSTMQVLGSMPIALADWGIEGPVGYGPLASVADEGTAEFLLVLEHE